LPSCRSKQNVIDTGDQYANTARQNVANAQNTLMSQAQAAESPDSMSAALSAQMPQLGATPAFSPLGNVFQNVSALAANSYNWQQAMNGQVAGAQVFRATAPPRTLTVNG
jgi:hypothetical protein